MLTVAEAVTQRQIELLREYRTRLIADVVTGKLAVREAAARLLSATSFPADGGGGIPHDTLDARHTAPRECGSHSIATSNR